MLQSVKISELPSADTLTEDDLIVVDQPDETKKATLFQVLNHLEDSVVEVIDGKMGQWLPSAVSIFGETTDYQSISVRGFYTTNDGGAGTWIATGKTDTSLAGTHLVTEAKIYNANGTEYALDISSGEISVLANGAKSYTYAECVDTTTDDFVCLGQVINGIQSHMTLGVSSANNINTYDGGKRANIIVPTESYRIGKAAAKLYSAVSYYLNAARIFVFAGASYKYSVTGKRLNGFQHGVDEITEKWNAVNNGTYWGSVSLQNVDIYGGTLFGDHTIRTTRDECSSGVGILVLNPEGFSTHGTLIRETFMWAMVETTAEVEATEFNQNGHAFDNDTIDYKYIVDAWVSAGITSRFGNFNRTTHYNSKFMGGRRGTYRNGCDWSALYNCEVNNRLAWRNAANVSGDIPEYIAVCTGTVLDVSGGYWGPAAAKDYNAKYGVVYSTALNHSFRAVYTEWAYNFLTVSAWGFNGKASRLQGLHLDLVSVYKDNFTEYSQIRFEGGCFGTIDDVGNYTYPEGFYHYDTPNGQTAYAIGSPVRDTGAFRHNGFDFKYGPYNMYLTAGTDWDSWRDRPYAKEMFNPYGMQINSGTAFLPWQIPATKSMVCFWIKDLTGNFDPRNIVAWITAASQDGPNTDEALYKSFAEKVVDFGNGYKMLMLAQKRLSAWDGQYTFARNANITVTVPAETPIVLKAVEAYTGGIPIFPNGCGNYTPESSGTSILSPVTNQVGLDSSLGGGLFFNGDIIGPWVHMRRTASGYRFSPSLTAGYTLARKMVTGGYALDSSFKVTFNATITAVNSNNTTIVEVPTAQLPYIAVGIPLYVTAGSSTSATGTFHLVKRIANADGTSSARYLVQGVLGAVGDTLTIDQSQIPAYTFYNDYTFGTVTASLVTVNGVSTATAHRSSVSAGVGYGGGSGSKAYEFYYNGGTTLTQRLVSSSATKMTLEAGGTFAVVGNTIPNTTATYNLGSASYTWNNAYLQNAVTVVSDEHYKEDIVELNDAEIECAKACAKLYRRYKLKTAVAIKGEDGARYHIGTIAQSVMQAFTDAGLDWTKYGIITYESWEATDAVVDTVAATCDEEGNELTPETTIEVTPAKEAGEIYMVRYDEFNSFVMAGQEARLAALESK